MRPAPDPAIFHAALVREEHETAGVPASLAAVPWALLCALFVLVVLSPASPRRRA